MICNKNVPALKVSFHDGWGFSIYFCIKIKLFHVTPAYLLAYVHQYFERENCSGPLI
jgi:hypothetical protein